MPRRISSIRLVDAVEEYVRDAQAMGLSPKTIESIHSTMRAFVAITGPDKLVRNIDKPDVTNYFTARTTQRTAGYGVLKTSTLNLHVVRLGAFFKWAEEEGYIDPNARPMRGRKAVKFIPRERARITADQFASFLDSPSDPRHRMLLATGLYTMLRTSEITSLKIADVSLADETINVIRWKTRERDVLPICAELTTELQRYMVWYETAMDAPLDPSWRLIPGNKQGYVARQDPATHQFVPMPLNATWLDPRRELYNPETVVQAALKDLGWELENGEGMHTLRRSAARELFESLREEGFDSALLTVMSWLGHKQPGTTMIYLGLEREADRRNRKYRGQTMFPRAAVNRSDDLPENVVILPAPTRQAV